MSYKIAGGSPTGIITTTADGPSADWGFWLEPTLKRINAKWVSFKSVV